MTKHDVLNALENAGVFSQIDEILQMLKDDTDEQRRGVNAQLIRTLNYMAGMNGVMSFGIVEMMAQSERLIGCAKMLQYVFPAMLDDDVYDMIDGVTGCIYRICADVIRSL